MHAPLPLLAVAFALTACVGGAPVASPDFPASQWRHEDGEDLAYLLAPGDEIEIIVHTAPELSRTVTIAPDGRIAIPYAPAIPASARTLDEVARAVRLALARELRDPDIDVLLARASSQRIFVGGAVTSPGLFDLPGQIDPLQAIILAGGVSDEGAAGQVIVMRRMPGGEVKSALFDVAAGLRDPALAPWTPLRRFDVVYVPRKAIADQNLFIQQYIRNALPIDFSLFYDVAGTNR